MRGALIAKMMPILVAGLLAASEKDTITEYVDSTLNMVKTTGARMQMERFNQVLVLAQLDGSIPEPQGFPEFLRRELGETSDKDPAMDPWEKEYRLDVEPSEYVVISAGPDGTFDNEDDLRVTVRREDGISRF